MAINQKQLYPATFTQDIVCSKGEVALTPGVFTLIGEYVVKADELVGIGRGAYAALNEAIGRVYAKFVNAEGTAIVKGKLRIMLVSSQDMPIGSKPVFLDVDLAQLTVGENTPSERYVLPFDGTLLSKDKKIQFFIMNNATEAITLDGEGSTVLIDMTRALV